LVDALSRKSKEGKSMRRHRTYIPNLRVAILIAISALILLSSLGPAGMQHARAADAPKAAATIDVPDFSNDWIQRLGYIVRAVTSEKRLSAESLQLFSLIVAETSRDARAALARDEKIIIPLREELRSLNLPPQEGEPEEPPEIAALRQKLQDRVSRVEGRIQKTRLVLVRAQNLRGQLSVRGTTGVQELLQVSPSLFEAATWRKANEWLSSLVGRIAASPAEWWEGARSSLRPGRIIVVVLAGLLAIALAFLARQWLRRRFTREETTEEAPSKAQRTIYAGLTALADVLLPWSGLGALAAALSAAAPSNTYFEAILINLCFSGMAFFAIWGLARAALAPEAPQWRILPVTEKGARSLNRRIRVIAIFVAFALFFKWTNTFDGQTHPEFRAAASLIFGTAYIALLLLLLPGRFWVTSDRPARRFASSVARGTIALGLLAVPILILAGYSTLANFFELRFLVTIVGVGATTLLWSALHEVLAQTLPTEGRYHSHVDRWLRLSDGAARQAQFWCGFLVDVVLFLPLAYALLIFYGLSPDLLNLWLKRIFTGIPVGNVTISLVDIILAIVVFVVGLVVSGWIRRRLAQRILTHTQMDIGVRESIASGVGYVGIVIAILLAIATLGLDLTQLALIASALSVGIGFGLRTVVENFVAGLLLLIERPIQSGDWIVVGAHEGTVKKISVRSTEIETFDRASLIVPNSELISQAVLNLTHKNKLARVAVPVGVAYGSDTDKVREVLLSCAEANEHILSYPQPHVLFRAFGDSSLNFELRGIIADAKQRFVVSSDLHLAVDSAFREAGIEIAFPQRDLHIRDANLGEAVADTEGDIVASAP